MTSALAKAAGGSATRRWLGALARLAELEQPNPRLLPDVVEDWAAARPDAAALLSDDVSLSYAALARKMRRYARWGRAKGLGSGSVVALMAPNRPETLAAWLGLVRTGATVALLNTNLRGAALAHCIRAASPSHAIVGAALADALASALPHLAQTPLVCDEAVLEAELEGLADEPLAQDERESLPLSHRALLIYTSGTTGLPKAANVSHRRIMTWSLWFAGLADMTADDRMYDCLPLYHSVGGVVAPGSVLAAGGSVVIRDGFSARRFWEDVRRWDCTMFQYIGELCRYLVASPAESGPHSIRLALGNGLRPDIWQRFKDRFAIPEILEFYAATEGSFSLSNVEGRVGSVGRVPPILQHRFPAAIVRHDHETGLPARGEDGLCIRAAVGEAGEAIGRLGSAGGHFEGYTDERADTAKILRDVFAPGDRWFRTGDLMRMDGAGFFYFVDRIGDTFRWKGENVATTEVAGVVGAAEGVADAVVYGVSVPGQDGRAGMAMIVPEADFSLEALAKHVETHLPAYARPVFLRIAGSIATTETFKHRRVDLAREGFDPEAVSDPLYVLDRETGHYRALDAALHAALLAGEVRL